MFFTDKIVGGTRDEKVIKQSFWMLEGVGDMMTNIRINSFKAINNSQHSCQLEYIKYLVDAPRNLMVLRHTHENYHSEIIKSKVFAVGETAGLTGCNVWVEYNNLSYNMMESIIAEKKTDCDCGEDMDCENWGAKEGVQVEEVKLLTWNVH